MGEFIIKRKNFFVPNLQYYHFAQYDWKNRTSFMKDKLNMNLVKHLGNLFIGKTYCYFGRC